MHRNSLALLLTVLFVTIPLSCLSLNPDYYAKITIQPLSEAKIQVVNKEVFTRLDGGGAASFVFMANILYDKDLYHNPNNTVLLEIKPESSNIFYKQGDGYSAIDGNIIGIACLGSKQWPLHKNEQYEFRLTNTNGACLLYGKIMANVYTVASCNHWVLLVISIFASILQIAVTFWPSRKNPETLRN
jgi:hypothetical protein